MKEAFVESRRRLLRARYSQYVLVALFAIVCAYFVVYLTLLLRLLGMSTPILVLAGLVTLIGLPIYFIRVLTRFWALDAENFSTAHPSRFLAKMREIHRSGIIMELAGVVLAILFVGNLKAGSQLADVLLFASVNLSVMEFVTMGLAISLWHPDPHYLLLASLDSETDPERNHEDTWLDGSLEWFNSILSSRRNKVVLKGDLNLESILFDPTYRRFSIDMLHHAAETENTQLFIEEVSNLMHKHPTEILERNSIVWKAKTQLGTLLSISLAFVGILVTISPALIPSLQHVIQSWLDLFH